MKILCIIDHFGSGGAQRQMVNLARGLRERGHDVEFFIYWPVHDFFRHQAETAGIPIHEYDKRARFSPGVILALIRLIRRHRYDVAISYLRTPNIYAELSVPFMPRSTRLVVSERNSGLQEHSLLSPLRRSLHRLADVVVSNSISQAEWLRAQHPWLSGRCRVIYNGLFMSRFARTATPPQSARDLRLIGVGRVAPQKNIECFIQGLAIFHERHSWVPAVNWAGRRSDEGQPERKYRLEIDQLLDTLPHVRAAWTWLGERSDVPELLGSHHALVLPSRYEGLPNAVCEALAAGLPVLASGVCDHPVLVPDGERGFLFDPDRPQSMADALERLLELDVAGWQRLSDAARAFAASELTVERMAAEYERLFQELHSETS